MAEMCGCDSVQGSNGPFGELGNISLGTRMCSHTTCSHHNSPVTFELKTKQNKTQHKGNTRSSKDSIPLGEISLTGHAFTIFALQEMNSRTKYVTFPFLDEVFSVL